MGLVLKNVEKIVKNIVGNYLLYILSCVIIFFISFFAVANLELNEENRRNILSSIIGLVGTIVPVTAAFVIFYIQKITSEYSPKFLVYIKRDPAYILLAILTTMLIVASIIFMALGSFPLDFQIIFALLIVFVFSLISSIIETIRITSPKNGILIPEKYRITRLVDRIFDKYEQKTENKKLIDTGAKLFTVPLELNDTELLQNELVPIRDIVAKAIEKNSLQEASDGLYTITDIAVHYLGRRKQYSNNNDAFIHFIYTEFGIIQQLSISSVAQFHLRLHPILIECWEKISMAASEVRVGLPEYTSSNSLLCFPTKAIQELIVSNFPYFNSSTPMFGCAVLEKIAYKLIDEGYPWQAQEICDSLSFVSQLGVKVPGYYFISRRANQAIVNISFKALVSRERLLGREHLYYSIQEMFRKSLSDSLVKSVESENFPDLYSPSGAVLCRLYDFRQSITTPHIIAAILNYQEKPDVYNSVETLKIFNRHIFYPVATKLAGPNNTILTRQYIDTIYLCSLIILSTINKEINLRILPIVNERKLDLKNAVVVEIILNYINDLWILFKKGNRDSYSSNEVLDAIFSILIICFYTKDKVIHDFAVSEVEKLINSYKKDKYSSDDTFFLYCRMFKKISRADLEIPEYVEKNAECADQCPGADKKYPIDCDAAICNSDFQWKLLGTEELGVQWLKTLNEKIWVRGRQKD